MKENWSPIGTFKLTTGLQKQILATKNQIKLELPAFALQGRKVPVIYLKDYN